MTRAGIPGACFLSVIGSGNLQCDAGHKCKSVKSDSHESHVDGGKTDISAHQNRNTAMSGDTLLNNWTFFFWEQGPVGCSKESIYRDNDASTRLPTCCNVIILDSIVHSCV